MPASVGHGILFTMNTNPTLLERLGNAMAFGLVLTILSVGAFSIYGIVRGEQELFSLGSPQEVRPTARVVVARPPTLTPIEGVSFVVVPPTSTVIAEPSPPAEPSATSEPQITESPSPTATETVTPEPSPSPTDVPTEAPTATPPPTATFPPTETPVPTAVPPTATPTFPFQVVAAGPDYSRGCTGHYIFGFVRDRTGAPIPGLRVRVYNEFGLEIPAATTKEEPRGWYDVLISGERARWYVQVVDGANNPMSPAFEVLNTGNFIDGVEACWHQVDFGRTS